MECGSLAFQWDKLGGFLGLDSAAIAGIRGNHPNDNSGCWNEVLNQWIKQNFKTEIFGEPSWRTLLKVIARVDKLLFQNLARKHGN